METLILSANDQYTHCPSGRLERAAPGLSNWQGNEYSYCSLLRQSGSDLNDQGSGMGKYYMPVHLLSCGFHSTTEEHSCLATTSVAESQRFRSNNIKCPASRTWPCNDAFSKVDYGSGDRVLGMQGCRSWVDNYKDRQLRGSPVHGWTTTRIGNYEIITGQVVCRYSSNCFDGKKSLQVVHPKMDGFVATGSSPIARGGSLQLFAKKTPDTVGPTPLSILHRPKSCKHLTNGAKIIGKGPSTSTLKSNSCKESEVPAGGGAVKCLESIHNRLANKVPCGGVTSDINGSALVIMEGVQEEERAHMCTDEGKGTVSCYRPSSERDIFDDHGSGLTPLDPIITSGLSAPLTGEGSVQEGSQSALSPPVNERWAGPAFSNSPPPGSLPLPTFTSRQMRTSLLEIPKGEVEFHADAVSISAPGSPSRSFSVPSVATFQSHLDINRATKNLRILLNLDSDT